MTALDFKKIWRDIPELARIGDELELHGDGFGFSLDLAEVYDFDAGANTSVFIEVRLNFANDTGENSIDDTDSRWDVLVYHRVPLGLMTKYFALNGGNVTVAEGLSYVLKMLTTLAPTKALFFEWQASTLARHGDSPEVLGNVLIIDDFKYATHDENVNDLGLIHIRSKLRRTAHSLEPREPYWTVEFRNWYDEIIHEADFDSVADVLDAIQRVQEGSGSFADFLNEKAWAANEEKTATRRANVES